MDNSELNTSDKVIDALASNKISLKEAKTLITKMIEESCQTMRVSIDLGEIPSPNGMPPPGLPTWKKYKLYPPGMLPGGGCSY